MTQVLVTGANGQLGAELRRLTWPDGWEVVATHTSDLDLNDTDAIARKVAERPWAAVINAGAYTAVDKAEEDVAAAWRINALAPAALAHSCAAAGIPIVQVSTDYVFPGDTAGPIEPSDPVGPFNVYGASKLGGELAVSTAARRYLIVRTAWVVSAHGTNFVKTMLRLGETRDTLSVVADQHGCPTSAMDLAAAIATMTKRFVDDAAMPSGTYHFTNSGPTTWHSFANTIFSLARKRGWKTPSELRPIASADYPTLARRPANSVLSLQAIEQDFGIAPRRWDAALSEIIDELSRNK